MFLRNVEHSLDIPYLDGIHECMTAHVYMLIIVTCAADVECDVAATVECELHRSRANSEFSDFVMYNVQLSLSNCCTSHYYIHNSVQLFHSLYH